MIDLLHGDCLEIMKNIPDNSINCVITSPPYNKKFFSNQKKTNQIWKKFQIDYNDYEDNLPIEKYESWMIDVINSLIDKLTPDGSLFFNHKPIRFSNQIYHPLNFILKSKAIIYQEIIWDRKNSPNIRNDILVPCTERIYWIRKEKPKTFRSELSKDFISEVWAIPPDKQTLHPAPFTEQIVKNCMFLTTEENDTLFDPFMGIGTVGKIAKENNRNFIGIELDNKYFNIAKNRIKETQNAELDK